MLFYIHSLKLQSSVLQKFDAFMCMCVSMCVCVLMFVTGTSLHVKISDAQVHRHLDFSAAEEKDPIMIVRAWMDEVYIYVCVCV
jgi:hypothetical protein